MRLALLGFGSVLLLASPSYSGIFNVNALLQVSAPFGASATVSASASGVQSTGGGIAGVPSLVFSFSSAVTPTAFGIDKVTAMGVSVGPGSLSGAGGALGAQGVMVVFAGAAPVGNVDLTPIGGGGTSTGVLSGIFPVTLQGAPWTTGVVTATGTGSQAGTVMATGGDSRTVGGAGTVVYVTASTFGFPAVPVTRPATSVLTLTYTTAPEPGASIALLLSALGIAVRGGSTRRHGAG